MQRGQMYKKGIVVAVLMFIAGLLHLVAFPERFSSMPLIGILFIAIAICQLTSSWYFYRQKFVWIVLFTILLNSLLLLLWALTQIFHNGNEPITVLNMIRKGSELVVVILLLAGRSGRS